MTDSLPIILPSSHHSQSSTTLIGVEEPQGTYHPWESMSPALPSSGQIRPSGEWDVKENHT